MNCTSTPMPLGDGRFAVPGNRWDLLDHMASRPTRVAVVIPYYDQPNQLALVLRALELQDLPADLIEVVIADDGSTVAPDLADTTLHATVVRQDDRGFRAAAARNLGAAVASAGVLCFLDADTVPEPGYLRRLTRLPSLLPDAISVGRRRHADLAGWTPDMLATWWSGGGGVSPPVLPEPRWLTDAYDASADLLHADQGSYRHVISAVMCCSRFASTAARTGSSRTGRSSTAPSCTTAATPSRGTTVPTGATGTSTIAPQARTARRLPWRS